MEPCREGRSAADQITAHPLNIVKDCKQCNTELRPAFVTTRDNRHYLLLLRAIGDTAALNPDISTWGGSGHV